MSAMKAIQAAREKSGGDLKANISEPLHRLTEALVLFFERNSCQPDRSRMPVTTKLVVAKGMEARKRLLEMEEKEPFLTPKEKSALEAFTGSESWAKKFAKRHKLKLTGARVIELGTSNCSYICLHRYSHIRIFPSVLKTHNHCYLLHFSRRRCCEVHGRHQANVRSNSVSWTGIRWRLSVASASIRETCRSTRNISTQGRPS